MPPPVTLKDLANALGLSVPAVSLGLRHAGNISEATCARIEEAAKRLGYRPNTHAAALSSRVHEGAKHSVPLVIFRMSLQQQSSFFYPVRTFIDGTARRAAELGYTVQLVTMDNSDALSHQLKILYNRGVQGIFHPPVERFLKVNIDWSRFSVIACGRYDRASPFHTVRQEVFESTRLLLNEAIKRGYRRIIVGLLRHEPKIVDDFARMAAASITHPPNGKKTVVHFSPQENFSEFVSLVTKKGADAVIGFSVGHYFALLENGFKIPEDIGFATLHGARTKGSEFYSGLVTEHELSGVAAANRMDAMIRHHERGIPRVPEQIAIPCEWHEGTTLPVCDHAGQGDRFIASNHRSSI